jgi:hypothetical protein
MSEYRAPYGTVHVPLYIIRAGDCIFYLGRPRVVRVVNKTYRTVFDIGRVVDTVELVFADDLSPRLIRGGARECVEYIRPQQAKDAIL